MTPVNPTGSASPNVVQATNAPTNKYARKPAKSIMIV